MTIGEPGKPEYKVVRDGCKGTGFMPVYRCPTKFIGNRKDILNAQSTTQLVEAFGSLPVAGGWQMQDSTWVKFLRVLSAERTRLTKDGPPSGNQG